MPPSAIQDNLAKAVLAANSPLSFAGSSGLLATHGSRTLLRYLVMCALPAGGSLVTQEEEGGAGETFPGELGLAASWATLPLDADQRRWVSACLLAKTNLAGVVVSVSNSGPHPELWTTPQELLDYPAEEGAFYGDVFANVPEAHACRGSGPDDAGGMINRRCAVADPDHPGLTLCGFAYAGFCADACLGKVDGEFYSGCDGLAGRADQVITTHVAP